MIRFARLLMLGAAGALLVPCSQAAPAGGLYKTEIPPGAALVRVFNAGAPMVAGKGRLADRPMQGMDTGELTAYSVAVAGTRSVSCGAKSTSAEVREGSFNTLICGSHGEAQVVTDPTPVHANKTFIILYNLTPSAGISLKTANGKVGVIEAVSQGATGSREINPVRVELSLFKGEQAVFKLGQVVLAPEKVYSLFVIQVGDEVRAYLRESLLNAEV